VLVVAGVQLLEQPAQGIEARQGLALELFHFARHRLGAAFAVVVAGFVVVVEVFFGHVVVGLVGVGKAIDKGRDHHRTGANFLGHVQDFVDGGGRLRDRGHHLVEAAFDALGDFDLALAREQFDRAHFAHVHAHRVGGAAKLAVHRGERGLGFFFGFFFGGRSRAGVGQQQRFGVGRLLIDRHAHVVEQRHHDFERFGLGQLVGQVVVDFAVRQVAARLAELDQGLEVVAPGLGFFFGQDGVVEPELFHQGALFGLADFHAQGLGLFDRLGRLTRIGGAVSRERGIGIGAELFFEVDQIDFVADRRRGRNGLGQRRGFRLAAALDRWCRHGCSRCGGGQGGGLGGCGGGDRGWGCHVGLGCARRFFACNGRFR